MSLLSLRSREEENLGSKSPQELEQIINDTVMENNILRSRAATALILSSSASILATFLEHQSPEFYSTLGVSALSIGYALRQAVRTARHGYLKTLVELYETKRQGRIRELYPQ